MYPFFSIIIPTFNREFFLRQAINSVLTQTYGNFELIVIDDGSTDGTESLLAEYKEERLQVVIQKNHGAAHARNRGIEKAKGEWIAFLDSDDHWIENKLERVVDFIEQYPAISFFHTDEIWYRRGKILHQKKKHKKPDGWVYAKMLPLCCIGMSTAVVKKEVFEDVGVFDERFEACEDYDLWLRVTHAYEVKLIPEPLTVKQGGRPDQLSASVWGLDRFRIKALIKMLDSGILNKHNYDLTMEALERKQAIFNKGAQKRGRKS